jgi:DNA-binding XRE family transcriptional regulator
VSGLRAARDYLGLAREKVAPQLDPPIASKTLERWEKGERPVPRWRLIQLAEIYGVAVETLEDVEEAVA